MSTEPSAGDLDGPAADPRWLLIVGAGPGLGAAVARRFGREGFRVTLAARDADRTARLASEVRDATGAEVDAVVLDAAHPAALRERLVAAFRDGGAAPGVVVYSGGRFALDDLLTVGLGELGEAYAINVVSAIMTAQAVVPAMRAAGQGTLILTGGGVADALPSTVATLSLGKVTLRAVAKMLHAQLAPEGIRAGTVTIDGVIEPGGPFDPDRIAERYWQAYASPAGDWQAEYRYEG
jgi:short-subunit dehydrogenase